MKPIANESATTSPSLTTARISSRVPKARFGMGQSVLASLVALAFLGLAGCSFHTWRTLVLAPTAPGWTRQGDCAFEWEGGIARVHFTAMEFVGDEPFWVNVYSKCERAIRVSVRQRGDEVWGGIAGKYTVGQKPGSEGAKGILRTDGAVEVPPGWFTGLELRTTFGDRWPLLKGDRIAAVVSVASGHIVETCRVEFVVTGYRSQTSGKLPFGH